MKINKKQAARHKRLLQLLDENGIPRKALNGEYQTLTEKTTIELLRIKVREELP